MFTRRQLRAGLVLCLMFFACLRGFAEKIADIHPVAYVTDLAGVIDPATTESINQLCSSLDEKTHAQIAVVTVRSLEGQPIEDYAVDLFKHLGVGQKKEDRGILLLVAPQERRYRIEVGYGLEPVINDARAGDVGRAMVPYLRESNYSAAINTGVKQLAAFVTSGVAPVERTARQRRSRFPLGWIVIALFGVILLINGIVDRLRSAVHGGTSRRPRSHGGNWWIGPMGGGGFGGGDWGGGFGGSSGGFGGFGGGSSGGGGASGSW